MWRGGVYKPFTFDSLFAQQLLLHFLLCKTVRNASSKEQPAREERVCGTYRSLGLFQHLKKTADGT